LCSDYGLGKARCTGGELFIEKEPTCGELSVERELAVGELIRKDELAGGGPSLVRQEDRPAG
jgi:hypothetical protein